MPPNFRQFMTEPGEPLISSLAPHDMALRFVSFMTATGLDDADVVMTPTCTVPLPLYPPRYPSGHRRWAGILPEAMWHPLMWLPTRLGERVLIDTGDGPAVETDEQWAARVMLEMTASGLYDETNGAWLDVLADNGIDVDTRAGRNQVSAWLDGADDDILSAITLDEWLPVAVEDPVWAVKAAHTNLAMIRPVQWTVHALALIDDCDDVLAAQADIDDGSLHQAVRQVATIASQSFASVPGVDSTWWSGTLARWDGSRASLLVDVVPAIRERLDEIRAQFWDEANELAALNPFEPEAGSESGSADEAWNGVELVWGATDQR